jgi:hypothetical protein
MVARENVALTIVVAGKTIRLFLARTHSVGAFPAIGTLKAKD